MPLSLFMCLRLISSWTGVLSLLDAATNDLASLINRLDLEATPASTTKGSPIRPLKASPSVASLGRAGDDSPLRKMKKSTFNKDRVLSERPSMVSITSLRPYASTSARLQAPPIPIAVPSAQLPVGSQDARRLIGKQIAPWSDLDWQVSPKKKAQTGTVKPFRPSHRRTVTPGPEIDLIPIFQPLRPAAQSRTASVEQFPTPTATPVPNSQEPVVPSSTTFGPDNQASKVGRRPSNDLGFDEPPPPSPTPPAKPACRHSRKSSVLSVLCDTGAALPPESLKSLGLTGTLGGPEPEIDLEDEDSDIPDELQALLSGQSDDDLTEEFRNTPTFKRHSPAPSPGLPPLAALPPVATELSRQPTP